MIQLDYKDPRPLYIQIKSKIKKLVITGVLKPDERIPSVRELAQTLTINPNTIQKAYKELESEGVLYSVRGKGNFVSRLDDDTVNTRRNELFAELSKITAELHYLQLDEQAIIDYIKKEYEKCELKKHEHKTKESKKTGGQK
jgi:GntR family transcriptional regulator